MGWTDDGSKEKFSPIYIEPMHAAGYKNKNKEYKHVRRKSPEFCATFQ
jgi:hypothetical protein